MDRRNGDQRCAAVVSTAVPLEILRRLAEYQRGYADGRADRRSAERG